MSEEIDYGYGDPDIYDKTANTNKKRDNNYNAKDVLEAGDESEELVSTAVPVPASRPFGRQLPSSRNLMLSASGSGDSGDNSSRFSIASDASSRMSRKMSTRRLSTQQRLSVRASLRHSIRLSKSSGAGGTGSPTALAGGGGSQRASVLGARGGGGGGQAMRQQSWYKDLLDQGMTAADIAALLGDEGDDDDEEAEEDMDNDAIISGKSSDNKGAAGGGGKSTEAFLEQHAIMAHSEARRRLQERLGYDPWERAQQEEKQSKKKMAPTTQQRGGDDDEMDHVLFPSTTVKKNKSNDKDTSNSNNSSKNDNKSSNDPSTDEPSKSKFAQSIKERPPPIFSWSPQETLIEQRRFRYTVAMSPSNENNNGETSPDSGDGTAPAGASSSLLSWSDLQMGQAVPSGSSLSSKHNKVPPGKIVVRCLGCRQSQVVSFVATLVRCSNCQTVSPASTTRK